MNCFAAVMIASRAARFHKSTLADVSLFCLKLPHLEQQAIPPAAIPDCTNHLSVVNTLRESGFDSACAIEGLQLFGGEFQIQTGEIVLELRYLRAPMITRARN